MGSVEAAVSVWKYCAGDKKQIAICSEVALVVKKRSENRFCNTRLQDYNILMRNSKNSTELIKKELALSLF